MRSGSCKGTRARIDGYPVIFEAFAGNTTDPMTVGGKVAKPRARFGLDVCRSCGCGRLTMRSNSSYPGPVSDV